MKRAKRIIGVTYSFGPCYMSWDWECCFCHAKVKAMQEHSCSSETKIDTNKPKAKEKAGARKKWA